MITPDLLSEGQLYHTTRGIAQIQDFYTENDLDKVHILLHVVNKDCGVTPTGQSQLMSTTPDILCDWINRFPKDLAERKQSLARERDLQPDKRERAEADLERIKEAELNGPIVNTQKPEMEI